MSGVKIKKIPMKNLSPKEMAELAFDRGVSRGSSSTANTLGRGGLKRGAYGQGVGKMNKGGAVRKKNGGAILMSPRKYMACGGKVHK